VLRVLSVLSTQTHTQNTHRHTDIYTHTHTKQTHRQHMSVWLCRVCQNQSCLQVFFSFQPLSSYLCGVWCVCVSLWCVSVLFSAELVRVSVYVCARVRFACKHSRVLRCSCVYTGMRMGPRPRVHPRGCTLRALCVCVVCGLQCA